MQRPIVTALVLGSLALGACHGSDRERRREERRERQEQRAGGLVAQPSATYPAAAGQTAYPAGTTTYPAAAPGTYPGGAAPMVDSRESRRERRRAEREGRGYAAPAASTAPTSSSGVLNDAVPMNPN